MIWVMFYVTKPVVSILFRIIYRFVGLHSLAATHGTIMENGKMHAEVPVWLNEWMSVL